MKSYLDRPTLFVALLTFFLCSSCENYKMKRDMERLLNQHISYPTSMQCFEGEKFKYLNLQENHTKIVIWYDSTECGECRIHNLPTFKNFENYCQNLTCGPDLVFLFSPSHKMISQTLDEASISTKLHDYPIYIDTANQFYKLNPHIPANNLMHSFLLDSEGKVVLVGNPIQNQAMFDLYKKTIEEMMN